MRNLRKRRKLIRQMEQANKIPDKLMPQEIKDMLDVAGFRPVIENTPNSAEIKINSGRSNALRCLAVVAAFVLVIGFPIRGMILSLTMLGLPTIPEKPY